MNSYKFKDLKIGQTHFFKKKTNFEDLNKFTNLSGDNSLIHTNNLFAKKAGFKNRIFHGAYLVALFSKLIGTKLPGKYGLLIFIDIKFNNPVYIGETLTISGKVIKKQSALKCVTVQLNIKVNNKINVTGTAVIKLFI